ncbi:hypothetical protein [Maribellus maritimus]|uniref:hypothetical protein n=1 Tax=Maribellus maritimus TaxID=2870838 RepID=UPI001EEC2CAE|nr:hypothetical protein [Maribellus maritimus]MCG6185809.1 hypothetical protein [Maribellus maritimus]
MDSNFPVLSIDPDKIITKTDAIAKLIDVTNKLVFPSFFEKCIISIIVRIINPNVASLWMVKVPD